MENEEEKKTEINQEINDDIKQNDTRNKKKDLNPFKDPFFIIFAMIFYGGIAWYVYNIEEKYYIKKEPLKTDIIKMIQNGAKLDDIKHYYTNANAEEWGLIDNWNDDKKDYYLKPISLLHVLKDIKNDKFLSEKIEDDEFINEESKINNIKNLTRLIIEYKQRNPFDELEESQKEQFNNVRIKLGKDFVVIEQELYKLSSNMQEKNKLVNEYLSSSNTSLYVSIGSFAFAFLTTIWFQFSNRKRIEKINNDKFDIDID